MRLESPLERLFKGRLVPFWYIWRILREAIEVAPNYENAVHVTHYGWMAVVFAIVLLASDVQIISCKKQNEL